MKKRILSLVLALCLLASIAPAVAASEPSRGSELGMSLAGMSTTDLHGNPFDGTVFNDYQLTLLNIWATWCGPCLREMPDLNDVYNDFLSLDVNVLGLLIEDDSSTASEAIDLCDGMGIDYTSLRVILDETLSELCNRVTGNGIPVSVLVNRDGTVLLAHTGGLTYQGFVNLINKFIGFEPETLLISPQLTSIIEGESHQLSAELLPEGSSALTVKWESSATNIATVDETGLLTGIAPGNAVITASLNNGVSADMIIVVETNTSPLEPITKGMYFKPVDPANEVELGIPHTLMAFYEGACYILMNEANGNNLMMAVSIPHWGLGVDNDGDTCIKAEPLSTQMAWLPDVLTDPLATNKDETPMLLSFKSYDESTENPFIYYDTSTNPPRLFLGKTGSGNIWNYIADDGLVCSTDPSFALSLIIDGGTVKFGLLPTDDENFIPVTLCALTGEVKKGDANCDGNVNTGDAAAILQYTINTFTMSIENLANADFNGDSKVNTGDAAAILQSIL